LSRYSGPTAIRFLASFPTRRSSDLLQRIQHRRAGQGNRLRVLAAVLRVDPRQFVVQRRPVRVGDLRQVRLDARPATAAQGLPPRSEEHTSELQSRVDLVCRLLLEKK